MKKKTINKITLATLLGVGLVFLISCTANFAKKTDTANIMYAYDMGTTRYFDSEESAKTAREAAINDLKDKENDPYPGEISKLTIDGVTFDNIYTFQDYRHDYEGGTSKTLDITDTSSVLYSAKNNKIAIPSDKYWSEIDKKVLKTAWKAKFGYEITDEGHRSDVTVYNIIHREETLKSEEDLKKCGALVMYGGLKFYLDEDDSHDNWSNMETWTNELRNSTEEGLGLFNCPSLDFITIYKSFITNKVSTIRSCITITGGEYGNFGYNHNKVYIEKKDWGYAWSRGFLEGLLVYPVAWLTETFSTSFHMGGWGQLGAILCVTFIVRTFLLLVSLKSTIGQQKMQLLQPELAKIQAKYPNANTNAAEKQRLAQEQMALYKKHKINPIGTLLVLIVQFPLFIGVWGAMQGSASLATDKVMNLYLSESIWNTLTNTTGLPSNTNGWWTALTLFILMAVAQFVAMKLPQWMQKHHDKKMPKLTANPTQDKSQKQMKWFGYIMLIFIIFMGFTLPAGMGVYWLAGALFSIVQTLVIQAFMYDTKIKRFFIKLGSNIKQLFKSKKSNNVSNN